VEALDEVYKGLLRPLFDLVEVDAGSPLLTVGDKLANKPIHQVLKT